MGRWPAGRPPAPRHRRPPRSPERPPLPRRGPRGPRAGRPGGRAPAPGRRRNDRPPRSRGRAAPPPPPEPRARRRRYSPRATVDPRAGYARDRSDGRRARPWHLPRRMWRLAGARGPPPRAASPPRATAGPRAGAIRHARPRCRERSAEPWRRTAAAPPRPEAGDRPPASLPAALLRYHALVLGPRERRQPETAESRIVLEKERQPEPVVGPADAAHARAGHVRREVEHVVGLAQRDEHLPPVGQPARISRLPEALVGHLDAAEIRLQRFILRGDLDGIGCLVELAPSGRALVRGCLAQLVDPILAVEVAQQADHLIVVGDRELIREAHQEWRGAGRGGARADPCDLEAAGADGQIPGTQQRHPGRHRLVARVRPAPL